jgi:hypothetical protein
MIPPHRPGGRIDFSTKITRAMEKKLFNGAKSDTMKRINLQR